mmetsp:Transcript_68100/g.99637  ORF Transcript_68100/g.99637 Transcript_68100/m.99637 type:complete len:190 (-) Transcript_68100:271-840(-)
MNQWESLDRSTATARIVFKDTDFVILDMLPPATVKSTGAREEAGRVVVRATYLKLNLKRKFQGELESMQSDRFFQIPHEALLANIIMYYLESVPAFALPPLAQSYPSHIDWESVALTYANTFQLALVNQTLAQVLNPFKVKQVVRNAVAVTAALSRLLADRSKLQGVQRGLVQVLRAVHQAAKKAIADL